jgi:hypothetical protein
VDVSFEDLPRFFGGRAPHSLCRPDLRNARSTVQKSRANVQFPVDLIVNLLKQGRARQLNVAPRTAGNGAHPTATATNSNRRCAVSADLRPGYQALERDRIKLNRGASKRCAAPPRTVPSLDPGKAQLGEKSIDSLLNVLVMFTIFLVTSSTDGGEAMSDTRERPSGPDWRGRCAGRSRPRSQHPPQPEGETHLFFACIIRRPDRRDSTPARDQIKLNRGASPTPTLPRGHGGGRARLGGGRHRRFKQYDCITTCRLSAMFPP